MKIKIYLSILLLISISSIYGCKRLETKKQSELFNKSLSIYGAALRWGRYTQAANFHINEKGESALVDLTVLEEIGITNFDVIKRDFIPSTDVASSTKIRISADIGYFHKYQGTLKKLTLNQQWWYDKKNKLWLINSAFPEFK